MFVIGTTSLSILGVGPAVTRDLGVPPGAEGWLVTAFAATFAVAAPVAQFALGKRFSPRRLIILGAAVLTGALIWASLAAGFEGLLLSRIVAALGGALIAPTAAALAVAMAPDGRRGAVLAIVFTGFTLSTVAGVPIMTQLALALSWRGAMAAVAAAALLYLLLVLVVLPREAGAATAPQIGADGSPGLWRPAAVLLTTLGMLAAQFTIYALMAELLGGLFGVSDESLALSILLFGVLGVAGNAAAGVLTDRIGANAVVWLSLAGLAVMLLLLLGSELGPLYGSLVLAGCAFVGTLFTTPQQNRLVELVHQDRHALILAMNSSASYLGIACGSGLASLLATNAGLTALPLAALILLALTGAMNLLLSR